MAQKAKFSFNNLVTFTPLPTTQAINPSRLSNVAIHRAPWVVLVCQGNLAARHTLDAATVRYGVLGLSIAALDEVLRQKSMYRGRL